MSDLMIKTGSRYRKARPSEVCESSGADELITKRLKEALALVDVKVLDHIILASQGTLSFAERGLL